MSTTNLFTLAARVATIEAPSKRIGHYKDALTHAAEMAALPQYIPDREVHIKSTRSWALYRLGKLSIEDRARVEAVRGVIG